MQIYKIDEEYITLVKFLKLNDLISSGGQAKYYIEENNILLNNKVVFEKRKKIYSGDILIINDATIKVESAN